MNIHQYFEPVATAVFDSVLKSLGAIRSPSKDPLTVRYEADDWFLECIVLLEDGPQRCPRVVVGPLPELGFMARDKQIDVLHTTPIGSVLRSYNFDWCYESEDEMRISFEKVRDRIFIPFTVPLLRSPRLLESAVRQRSAEINARWEKENKLHNASVYRSLASKAWATKDFAEFIAQMAKIDQIDPAFLTSIDHARLSYARKHAG